MRVETISMDVVRLARDVRAGRVSAVAVAREAIARIHRMNTGICAVTRLFEDRALTEATRVDAVVAMGGDPGPLAGVPYGVKDLFDIAGEPTTAGAILLHDAKPADRDAEAIRRLSEAGAVLVASLNMDAFAYGFVTDNACYGQTRNPHDPDRFAGGSSGGSAAAVASGMLAFSLGSDTNGSVRVPASLCGLFGIKPSHGSLPMDGVYPFVDTLDDIGAFAGSAADLALVDSVLRGSPVATLSERPSMAMLGGWFGANLSPEMSAALARLSDRLGDPPRVELPDVARARSAAFLITAYEGGRQHCAMLREKLLGYDPAVRDRLIAGAALPHEIYEEALAFRAQYQAGFDALFARHEVLIAPSVFGAAPRIDDPVVAIDGKLEPVRANLGLFTQPISYLGLPVVAAPVAVPGLPLGIQLIAAEGRDAMLLALASDLEERGLLAASVTRMETPE